MADPDRQIRGLDRGGGGGEGGRGGGWEGFGAGHPVSGVRGAQSQKKKMGGPSDYSFV